MCVALLYRSSYLLSSLIAKYLFLGNSEEKCLIVLLFLLLDKNNFEADLQWPWIISEDIRHFLEY